MTGCEKLANLAGARLCAGAVLALLTLAVSACVAAPPPPGAYYPPAGGAPGGTGPGYEQAPGYRPSSPAYAPAAPGYARPQAYGGPGRGVTRAEFIERRRQMAMHQGRDPERAAANAARQFDMMDTDHDGILEPAERAAWQASHPPRAGLGRPGSPGGPSGWQNPAPQY